MSYFSISHVIKVSKSGILILFLPILFQSCHPQIKRTRIVPDEVTDKKTESNKDKLAFYFMEGVIKKAQNTPKDAIPFFQEVLKIDTKHDASMYNIALIYFELKKPDAALPYAAESFRLKEENPWYARLLSDIYTQLNQPEKAIQVLEKAVKKHSDTDLKLMLADQYVRASSFRKAIEVFDSVEIQMGVVEEVSLQKHRMYQLLNETDKAALEIRKLIKQFPYEPKYYLILYDFLISESQENEAVEVLKELQKVLPENPQGLVKLGEYYRTKRSDAETAFQYLSKAFASQQLSTDYKTAYLQKLNDKNEVDKVLKSRLTTAFMNSGDKNPSAYIIRAQAFEENNQLDSARVYYLKSLEINELNQEVWIQLIELDKKMTTTSYLTQDCEKGLEVFPNDSRFLSTAGKAYYAIHQYDKSIRFLEKVDKLGALTTDELTDLYPFIGLSWFYKGNTENAKKWFIKALDNHANHTYTLAAYSYVLINTKQDIEKAKTMLAQVPVQEHHHPWVLRAQSLLLLEEKKNTEAIEIAESMVKQDSLNPDYIEFMGDVWFRTGNKEKALNCWKDAQSKGGIWDSLNQKIKNGSL